MKFGAWRAALMGATVSAAFAFVPGASASDPDGRPSTWTGFYTGIHIGSAWSDVNWADVSLVGLPVNFNDSGVIAGGQIGYNAQFGKLVLGIEAAISEAGLDHNTPIGGGISFGTNFNWIGTVTGRVGYASDQWLVYAKGGWAWASLDFTGTNPILPDSFSVSDTRTGWTAGAGIEWKLARNLSFGIEYNFIDLGSANASGKTAVGIPFTLTDVDLQTQSVTARLNVKFGQ